jgi:hypothetical protein
MKKYTKEIAVLAVLALFTPWANAQTANLNGTFDDEITGPTAGLQVTPAADPDPDFLSLDDTGATLGTLEIDESGTIVTRIDFEGIATGDVTTSTVTGGANDSVIINNDGITLNTVTTATDTTTLDRFVESVTTYTNDGNTTEFTAYATAGGADGDRLVTATGPSKGEALESLNVLLTGFTAASGEISEALVNDLAPTTTGGNLQIGGNANVDGVLSVAGDADPDGDPSTEDGYDGYDNVAQAIGTNVTNITNEANERRSLIRREDDDTIHIGENSFVLDDADTYNGGDAHSITINEAEPLVIGDGAGSATAVVVGESFSVDGDLDGTAEFSVDGTNGNTVVGGVLSVAGDADPDGDPSTEDGYDGVDNVAQAIGTNATDIASNDTDIAQNTNAITTLNGDAAVEGSVAYSIKALGVSKTGIVDVIEKSTVEEEEIIKLGSNTFTFNNTTDTISTSSGDINLAADVAITGDLEVAGDVFVGGRTQGLQSQIDGLDKRVDENARGIAMVAALQHTTVLPDMKHALDVSAAHFEGETGMALNYARRINDNVQINFGAASTTDFEESVIKAGIGVQW